MSDYIVRTATAKDASEISKLYKSVWGEYADRFPSELLQSRTPSTEGILEWMKKDTYFVAELADSLIGVVGCRLEHGTCCLTHLAIQKEYRRLGIGKALVERVIKTARDENASKVWLDTVPFLKGAISLYGKYGFKKCGHMRKHLWGLDMELYELVFE
ncbi:MAG: GNAT family N-acetyltransferase [Candidatus Thorarchaeota archaeon]